MVEKRDCVKCGKQYNHKTTIQLPYCMRCKNKRQLILNKARSHCLKNEEIRQGHINEYLDNWAILE